METNQTPVSPTSSQVTPGPQFWSPTTTAPGPTSRFHGDGVRYKGKLIGTDPVTSAEGEKMCWDSMMKLKGFEAAFRKQGRHKQRVWMKICSSGVKILDEKTGGEMYIHERSDISSVMKDESDPRALAYVYKHLESYFLFYFRMANLAEPVVHDIREVCTTMDQVPAQETAEETPQQSSALLVLEEAVPLPPEEPALENVFSPRAVTNNESTPMSSSELMQVFSVPMKDPLEPNLCPTAVSTQEPVLEPPKPALSKTQILSMFPSQPAGGAAYTPSPWPQQGIVGNQWAGPVAGPAVAPWLTPPGNCTAWPPAAPPTGHMMNNSVNSPPPVNAPPPAAPNTQHNLFLI